MQRRELTIGKSAQQGSRGLILMVAVFFLASTGVWAQDVWNGGSATAGPTNGFWSNAANWVADAVPSAGDTLTFSAPVAGGSRTTTNDLAANTEFNGITINGGSYVLSGSSIELGGANPQFVVNSGTETVNLNIQMMANTTFDANQGNSNPWLINGVISGAYSLISTGNYMLRFAGASQQTYTGGTIIDSGTISLTSDVLGNTGSMTIDSGATLNAANISATIGGLYGSGCLQKNGSSSKTWTIGNGGGNGNFTGYISMNSGGGSGNAVTKVGGGTQVIGSAGSITCNGPVTVSGGTLEMDGSAPSAGNYVVNSGAVLSGTGTIGFATGKGLTINSGGTLTPGAGGGTGLLTLAGGGLTVGSNAIYAVTLNGTSPGSYDSTAVTGGSVSLNSYSALDVTLGYTPNAGDSFDIISNATGSAVSGTFAGLPEGTDFMVGSTEMAITYVGAATGEDVVLTVVPEPSALVLAGLGLVGAYVFRRRIRT